jgi:hypothetical membrane protein
MPPVSALGRSIGSATVKLEKRLLFGPLSAVLFLFGTLGVAHFLPGYSHLRQDVSEIGALGTPTRLAFAVMVFAVAACLAVFGWALRDVAARRGLPRLAAYLIGFVVVSEVGIAIFATPHPLHGPFGMVSLIGFQAPGVLALTWRRDPAMRGVVLVSWLFFLGLWGASLSILLPGFLPDLARQIEPVAGLVQRSLFVAWFGWCAAAGLILRGAVSADPRA